MHIGLTFIGTSNYEKVKYRFNDEIVETNLFPKAFEQFFHLDKLLIVATKSAEDKHFKNCDCQTSVEIIRIPDGRNEEELWEVFERIYTKVPEKSNLIIDVTHSFRSLPIVSLSIIQYLKTLKNVSVDRIVYGAYEAKDEYNIAPVFDLTPFIDIIDWSYSIYDFVNHGNAELLRDKMKTLHESTYLNATKEKSKSLSGFGQSLNKLSNSLSIVRVKETFTLSQELLKKVDSVKNDIVKIPQSKPIEPLLSLLKDKYQVLGIDESEVFLPRGFNAQIKMLELYKENHQFMQAITLAREVLVSKLAVLFKLDPISEREYIEKTLNGFANKRNKNHFDDINITHPELSEEQKRILNNFVKIWERVRELRNDINHASMRKNYIPSETALNNIKQLIDDTKIVLKDYEEYNQFENY